MIGRGVHLGRLAGIDVRADWSLVVIVWLIASMLADAVLPDAAPGHSTAAYWIMGAVAAAGFFFCLLLHELAHAVYARGRGLAVRDITLWLLGGVTRIEGENRTAQDEFLMAAAGPATSGAIGAVLLIVGAAGGGVIAEPGRSAVLYLGEINVVLAVFNLLPAFPLDGGRVLRGYLWRRWGDRDRATNAAARAGRALGFGMVALGGLTFALGGGLAGLWYVLLGWFITSAAAAENNASLLHAALAGVRVADVMSPVPAAAGVDGPGNLPVVAADALLLDVLPAFGRGASPWIAVVDDGVYVGVLSMAAVEHVVEMAMRERVG